MLAEVAMGRVWFGGVVAGGACHLGLDLGAEVGPEAVVDHRPPGGGAQVEV
jgi:hypothetical protein